MAIEIIFKSKIAEKLKCALVLTTEFICILISIVEFTFLFELIKKSFYRLSIFGISNIGFKKSSNLFGSVDFTLLYNKLEKKDRYYYICGRWVDEYILLKISAFDWLCGQKNCCH